MSVDYETLSINSISTSTLNIQNKDLLENNTEHLIIRLLDLERAIREIVTIYKPLFLCIESGYINKLRPGAFGPLSKSISTIELSALNVDPYIQIFKYTPSPIKMSIGASFKAPKEEVMEKIQCIEEINKLINVKTMSEHEIDSVAIAYLHLCEVRIKPVYLLPI